MYTLILKEVDKGAFSKMSEENVTSKCQKKCKSCLRRYPHLAFKWPCPYVKI